MFRKEHCSYKLNVKFKAVYVVLHVQHCSMCRSSCRLQGEQQAANSRHQAEVFELKHQLSRLNGLAERGSQALQQKALVRTTAHLVSSDFICDA